MRLKCLCIKENIVQLVRIIDNFEKDVFAKGCLIERGILTNGIKYKYT